jgi:hypothetical protein
VFAACVKFNSVEFRHQHGVDLQEWTAGLYNGLVASLVIGASRVKIF